jgi:hypothetical protein
MTKTREKSDRCVVPEKDGNASGGKAATVSEQAEQLGLCFDVADSPKGDNLQTDMDVPGHANPWSGLHDISGGSCIAGKGSQWIRRVSLW